MSKYKTLDYFRGIAALAVVFFHRGSLPSFPSPLDVLIRYGEVGAYIFFVISGYVIYMSAERHFLEGHKGSIAFACKRIRRIYPAFWMSLILAYGVSVFISHESYSIADVLGSATLTYVPLNLQAPQVVYWTLVSEQQFYVVMVILILPIFRKARKWLILGSSIIGLCYGLGLLSRYRLFNSLLSRNWLEFELGIVSYFVLQRKVPRWVSVPIFITLFLVGWAESYRTQAASLFALFLIVIYPLDNSISTSRILFPFEWLGKISYSLYLLHLPAFAINDLIIGTRLPNDSLPLYASGILTALILASLSYLFFERPFLSSSKAHEALTETTLPLQTMDAGVDTH